MTQDSVRDAAPGQLLETLRVLEQRLHDPVVRRNPFQVAQMLADEFREFGQSGRVYNKAAVLQLLVEEATTLDENPIEAGEFALVPVSSNAALLTYRSTRTGATALRSSLWILRDSRWQMLFHQGTGVG